MNQHGNNMTTPHTGALRIKQFADEGRIIRCQWHRTDKDGRELACLLGAVGANVDSPSKCPAEVMPAWLAHLTPSIDDNTSSSAWPAIIRRYADAAVRWHVLTPQAWRRCEMIVKREALLIARPFDTSTACTTVLALINRSLSGDEPSESEWSNAAYAVAATRAAAGSDDAAAYAADVACAVAVAAADADAAAYAAAYAAAAANRTYVARTGAWDRIADACLSAIEHELEQA